MRSFLLSVVLVLSACNRAEPTPPTPAPAAAAIDIDDPQACAGCHAAVVAEWEESMHARAHHTNDPIYAGLRTLRMEKQGAEIADKCAQCHTPRAVGDGDQPAGLVGVSCATCHNVAAVHLDGGKKGAVALEWAEPGVLRGPHDIAEGAPAPHGTGAAAPHLTDGQSVCLACHARTTNPAGLDACTTGPEHEAYTGAERCTDCHMPTVEGPAGAVSARDSHASHRFLGPHRAWLQDDPSFLGEALEVSAAFDEDAGAVVVSLTNLTGHAFPNGFPGGTAAVVISGLDAAGAVVWEGAPSTLNKVYTDDEGAPTMPPFATVLRQDTRLKTGEQRAIRWEVPAEVVSVEVGVRFFLLPPPAAKALGLSASPEAAPETIASATARR